MNSRPLDLAQFDGHTPGLWIVNQNAKVISAEGFRAVANCVSGERGEQDAILIAAAPALLSECKLQREQIQALREALEGTLRVVGAYATQAPHVPFAAQDWRGMTEDMEHARAALKVAE